MKKIILLLVAVYISIFSVFAQAKGYYDGISGTGYALKTQLYNLIKVHTVDSYSRLWTDFKRTDADENGNVWDIYSDNPGGTDPYNYTFVTDQCGTYSGEGSCYNREHSFPKSWFNDASPMYSDLFHIYPTDGKVNGMRSNYPYGEVDSVSATFISLNGSKLGPCTYPGYTGTVFEPIDEYKGDLARTYFYMATCYQDLVSGWSSVVLDGSSDKVYVDWFLNMLLEWNQEDPVSQKEIYRNNVIDSIQGNRNPYIDHPEWVSQIWGGGTVSVKPEPTNHVAEFNRVKSITLSWNKSETPDNYLILMNKTGCGNFTMPIDGNLYTSNDTCKIISGSQSMYKWSVVTSGDYYFTIIPFNGSGSTSNYKTDGTVPCVHKAL